MTCRVIEPEFAITAFRRQYPAFADESKYSDAMLKSYWDMSFCYLNGFFGSCTQKMYFLLVAHLAFYFNQANSSTGGVTGAVSQTTIDKVSVTLSVLTAKNAWEQFLSTSPYGLALWALLEVKSSGGAYVGGSPERLGFRKVFGRF